MRSAVLLLAAAHAAAGAWDHAIAKFDYPSTVYPGYAPAAVQAMGSVMIKQSGGMLEFTGELTGLEASVTGGIHVHEGLTCADSGGHYFRVLLPGGMASDPWLPLTYTTDGTGKAMLQTTSSAGVQLEDAVGRAIVIHAADGTRVACVVAEGVPAWSYGSAKFDYPATVYPGYGGVVQAKGEVMIKPSGDGLEYTGEVSGLQPSVTGPAHVHEGTSCAAPGGPVLFLTYTTDATGKAVLQATSTEANARLSYAVGRVFVIHEQGGAPAACVVVEGVAAEQCPMHSAVAAVMLGAGQPPAMPIHVASDPATGMVNGAPWSWIPQDGVMLKSFYAAATTLRCGNYYGYQCRRTENGTQITVDCKSEVCDVYAFIYHEPPRSSQTNGRLPLTLPANGWETGSCAPEFCFSAQTGSPTGSPATSAPSMAPTQSTGAPVVTIPPAPTPATSAPSFLPVSTLPGGDDGELPNARKAGALDASEMECCRMTAFRKQVDGGATTSFTVDEAFGVMDAYYLVLAVAPGEMCDTNERRSSQEACEEMPKFGNAKCRWIPNGDAQPAARKAGALSGIPTSSPTASPVSGGRCVPNWCPRDAPQPPREAPPACSAPLAEPACQAPPVPQ